MILGTLQATLNVESTLDSLINIGISGAVIKGKIFKTPHYFSIFLLYPKRMGILIIWNLYNLWMIYFQVWLKLTHRF